MEFGVTVSRLVPGPPFLVSHLVDVPFGQPDVANRDENGTVLRQIRAVFRLGADN